MSSSKAGIFLPLKRQEAIDLECSGSFERAALFAKVVITPAARLGQKTGMALGLL